MEEKTYYVSMAVNGRITLEIKAKNFTDAFGKAETAFEDCDLKDMEVIGAEPVHVESEDGNEEADYV